MDDIRNWLAQQGYGGAPAPSAADQYAPGLMSPAPMSAANQYAPGLMSPAPGGFTGGQSAWAGPSMGGMGSRQAPSWGNLPPGMAGIAGSGGQLGSLGPMIPGFTGRIRPDPGFYDPATGMGGPRNPDGTPMTGGGGGVNQMAPGYDWQMGLQKAMQGLLGGMGPSAQGVSLGNLAGGNYGGGFGGRYANPGMGPSRMRY